MPKFPVVWDKEPAPASAQRVAGVAGNDSRSRSLLIDQRVKDVLPPAAVVCGDCAGSQIMRVVSVELSARVVATAPQSMMGVVGCL